MPPTPKHNRHTARPAPQQGSYFLGGVRHDVPPCPVGLYIVATPIGNLKDITLRALEILAGVDLILAEDTRVTRKLLSHYGIKTKTSALHDHIEEARTDGIVSVLADGASIALVSDAGTPLISDPGFKLVRAAAAAGCKIVPLPGPSSALAALVVSGLPSDSFMFAGFLPPKKGARRQRLRTLAVVPATLIFFESPRRLAKSLADMAEELGLREAAVMRELTKMFEEARRGPLDRLADHYTRHGPPKGEAVVVIGPPPAGEAPDGGDLDQFLMECLKKMSIRDAVRETARITGAARTTVYQRALALQTEKPGDGS